MGMRGTYARCSCRDGQVAGADTVTGRLCMGLVYAVWGLAATVALVVIIAVVS